jgi:hypothetical protein
MTNADLHIHSNYSDGSDTIDELARNIKQAKIDVFSLTDHDTVAGCKEMKKLFNSGFISGVELTLGYGIDEENKQLLSLIEKGNQLRKSKLETRIKYLDETWNIKLTKNELNWLYSRKSVVKTHLANILVSRGLASDNISAMRKYLDGCKSGDTRFTGEEAINAIKASGGVPVWAHPLGGEGEVHISGNEFLSKITIMKSFGIEGLECYYSRYDRDEIEFLVKCANEYGLLISGGSDYHGKNKTIELSTLSADNENINDNLLTILSNLHYS